MLMSLKDSDVAVNPENELDTLQSSVKFKLARLLNNRDEELKALPFDPISSAFK